MHTVILNNANIDYVKQIRKGGDKMIGKGQKYYDPVNDEYIYIYSDSVITSGAYICIVGQYDFAAMCWVYRLEVIRPDRIKRLTYVCICEAREIHRLVKQIAGRRV